MCGICGFVNYRNDEILKKMNNLLIHRGPDEEGYFISDRVSLASRRLKILDLESGTQPIYNEDKSIVVVFNGEIYNYREKRNFLISKGHIFHTKTDTEVIVHLYEEYDEDMFSHLRGMFAFALYDSKKNVFILARDHFGIKPVFWALENEKLFFASELKALVKTGTMTSDLNLVAMDCYFTRLYIPFPHTIYRKIKKLPPANYLIFKNDKWELKRYWKLNENNSIQKLNNTLLSEIDFLFNEILKEQMLSDVSLGLFLSGGIDSSTVLYYLSRNSNNKVKTFTISYDVNDNFNESDRALFIADFFDTEHTNIVVKPNIEATIKFLAENFDQPFADSSSIVTYLISKEAKRYITVALTGIGGDELFAGYPRYLGLRLLKYYLHLPEFLRNGLFNIVSRMPDAFDSFNYSGRIKRFFSGGSRSSLDEGYISWISYVEDENKKNMYSKDFYSFIISNEGKKSNFNIENNLLSFELENYLEGDLLYLADMASMLNSLELRVPFLDLRLVELMAGIPLGLKLKNFKTKYILKKLLTDKIPSKILHMPKHGFQVPLSRWLKSELKDFAFNIINSSDGIYYKKDFAKDMLFNHINGKANYSDQIYSILIFELWRKSVNVN